VAAAITNIDDQAWTPIRYPHAIYDDDEQRWISDAEVAETTFTGFTSRRQREHVTARLIVRRSARSTQTRPGRTGRSFRGLPLPHGVHRQRRPDARRRGHPRDHAIVEQVIAELKNGPLAHLPSGVFTAS
jgi:hypothetical protein